MPRITIAEAKQRSLLKWKRVQELATNGQLFLQCFYGKCGFCERTRIRKDQLGSGQCRPCPLYQAEVCSYSYEPHRLFWQIVDAYNCNNFSVRDLIVQMIQAIESVPVEEEKKIKEVNNAPH